MSPFEIIMLVCFGAAWPFSIYRSYKSKNTKGKSLFFLIIVFVGYGSGIVHKVFYNYDYVIFLYILNFIMVGIDIGLYLRNKRIEAEH
jgi:lipopolysaccharide export LptBFGC system permease protein LptF